MKPGNQLLQPALRVHVLQHGHRVLFVKKLLGLQTPCRLRQPTQYMLFLGIAVPRLGPLFHRPAKPAA